MKWSDIMWERHPFSSAQCARLSIGDYIVSIVTEINEPGLYEVAILNDSQFITLPGIHHDDDDDVLRYQTKEEVVGIIRKIESITAKEPLNVYS